MRTYSASFLEISAKESSSLMEGISGRLVSLRTRAKVFDAMVADDEFG